MFRSFQIIIREFSSFIAKVITNSRFGSFCKQGVVAAYVVVTASLTT